MSVMSTPSVFSSVSGFIAQTFIEQIPSNINKSEFFEKTCKEHNIALQKDPLNEVFSFEGQWNDFICIENFLQKQIIDWHVVHDRFISDDNVSLAVSPQIEKDITKISECIQHDSVLEIHEISEANANSIVSTQNQCIVSSCENIIPLGSSNVCNENGVLDHENEIYMDIQLSCRPSNGLFKDPRNTPVTVVIGTEESVMETICLESANNEQKQFGNINQSESSNKDCNSMDDWKKDRSRKYEEKAEFKYFCNLCSFKSKRQSHLKKHALLHERVCKLYSCEYCDFSTIRLGHLQRHIMQHSESQLTCPDCNYKTNCKSLFQKHQNLKHKAEKPTEEKPMLQCSKCSYSTTKEKLFERHQIVHTEIKYSSKGGKKYFECDKCTFKTTVKSNLARHVKNVHLEDRPFLCKACGQSFKRSDTLNQHLVVHASGNSNMNELQCPHCQKYYRSKTLLHEHILVHSDTRSYLCEICGAAFKTRAVQRKHVRYVHNNSKSFPCDLCSKKFNCSFAVKRHMKLHEPKTAVHNASKMPLKTAESTSAASDQWESSVMTMPIPEDVQVLVVQQDNVEEGVIFNEGPIFVQESAEVQMESTPDPAKAANEPLLPIEYVLQEEMVSQVCTSTDLGDQFMIQDGEVITLQFVP